MTRFRELDRKAHAQRQPGDRPDPAREVFLIEGSVAMGLLLQGRIKAKTSAEVSWFRSCTAAAAALAQRRPALAITGTSLPDAPAGEILDLLAKADVPTVLFTATLDRKVRERFTSPNIVDYFCKDAEDTVAQVVRTVARFTDTPPPPVLIVDDMASGRSILADLLRRQNYRIVEAASGVDALRILAEHDDIELVVTDHHMADMDGHELTQRIRARYPADRLRIIGISGSADPFLSASFLKAGASDFVYRPFIVEEVRYRIESNIETLAQIRHLRFLAERDPLTGLYNRRAFFERAHPIVAGLRDTGNDASGSGACIAILDIDHFKAVNDRHGHDAGDQVIRQVAAAIRDCCDEGGAVSARFGGEEFVLLFDGIDAATVRARCEALRQAIAGALVATDHATLSVTASLGVAAIHAGEGLDNALNAADQLLYMAKAGGRNRVMYDAAWWDAG
jgi:diguanylate cyclase (GGDEF)-like protein